MIYIYNIYIYGLSIVCIYFFSDTMISQPPMPGAPERPAIRRGGVPWCRAPAQQLGSPQLGKSLPAADTATLGGCARV